MVLLSTTVAEALRHRAFVGWRPRVVARWAALPVAALVTLVVLCAALPAKAGVRAEAAPCQSGRTRPIPPACSVGEAVPFARTTSRSLTAI
jgi:hypothetical protein